MKIFSIRNLRSGNAQSAVALFAIVFAGLLVSEQPAPVRVGPRADGSFLLNSGWLLRPAGEQIGVDTLPMRGALSKDGRFLLILNGGYKPPSISVIDVATKKEIKRILVRDKARWDAPATPGAGDAWYGLVFAPSGTRVYAGGGSQARVYEFEFTPETGDLKPGRDLVAVERSGKQGPQLHRRRCDFARRAPALCRRRSPGFDCRLQSQFRHVDRALENRQAPLSHPGPSFGQIAAGERMGRCHALSPRCLKRRDSRQVSHWPPSHRSAVARQARSNR